MNAITIVRLGVVITLLEQSFVACLLSLPSCLFSFETDILLGHDHWTTLRANLESYIADRLLFIAACACSINVKRTSVNERLLKFDFAR